MTNTVMSGNLSAYLNHGRVRLGCRYRDSSCFLLYRHIVTIHVKADNTLKIATLVSSFDEL